MKRKTSKTRKFAGGGDPFEEYRAKHPEYIEPEPGLEQVDKDILLGAAMPVGRVVSGLGKLGGAAVNRAALLARPRITNRLYNEAIGGAEHAAGDVSKKFAARNASESELDDIINSGYMRPRTTLGPRGKPPKKDKYFTMTDNPKGQTLRVPSDKVPVGRVVRRKDIEKFNSVTGEYEPLKKGGSVKKFARGGGIESRGKTKGRFV